MDLSLYRDILPEDFSAVYRRSLPQMSRCHLHDQFEIVLLPNGRGRLILGEEPHPLGPGSLVLLGSMDLHRFSFVSEEEAGRYVLFFPPDYADALSTAQYNLLSCFFFRPFPNAQLLSLDEKQTAALAGRMDRLIALSAPSAEWGRPLAIRFELGQLLLEINRLYLAAHGIGKTVAAGETYSRVYRILRYIHHNLTGDLSLGALSARFYISPHYLCTLFRQITGTTPAQYILNCRIRKAKDLLIAGCSVDEACSGAGFGNLTHFSRTFRQITGSPPKKYAAAHREQADGERR